jgi:hypothetical protein
VQRETLAIQIEALRFRTLPDGSRKRRSAARIASMLHVHKSAIKKILAAHPESAPKQTAPTKRRGRRVSVQFPQ